MSSEVKWVDMSALASRIHVLEGKVAYLEQTAANRPQDEDAVEDREAWTKGRDQIDLLIQEHLYVMERLQAGTMDVKEAREWLKRHGHE